MPVRFFSYRNLFIIKIYFIYKSFMSDYILTKYYYNVKVNIIIIAHNAHYA